MAEKKTSEAQLRANKAYYERNKDRARYVKARTSARSFVRLYATKEDMDELLEIFKNENPNSK